MKCTWNQFSLLETASHLRRLVAATRNEVTSLTTLAAFQLGHFSAPVCGRVTHLTCLTLLHCAASHGVRETDFTDVTAWAFGVQHVKGFPVVTDTATSAARSLGGRLVDAGSLRRRLGLAALGAF